jgi:hypothetical protein
VRVCKHVKSNAIVLVREHGPGFHALLGMGAGQPNRVDSVRKLAIPRAQENIRTLFETTGGYGKTPADFAAEVVGNSVLISDAFFPFPDNIEHAAQAGVKYIVHPAGRCATRRSLPRATGSASRWHSPACAFSALGAGRAGGPAGVRPDGFQFDHLSVPVPAADAGRLLPASAGGPECVLLGASLFFYAWGETFHAALMLVSIAMNYGFGLWAGRASPRAGGDRGGRGGRGEPRPAGRVQIREFPGRQPERRARGPGGAPGADRSGTHLPSGSRSSPSRRSPT